MEFINTLVNHPNSPVWAPALLLSLLGGGLVLRRALRARTPRVFPRRLEDLQR